MHLALYYKDKPKNKSSEEELKANTVMNELFKMSKNASVKKESCEEDCYFDCGRTCAALIRKACTNCAFFTTEKNYDEKKARAADRINHLPAAEQIKIRERYRIVSEPPILRDYRFIEESEDADDRL